MRKNLFTNWSVEKLQNEVDKIVRIASNLYNYNYNNCSVTFNNRLKRAYAQIYYETGKIEVSNFLVSDYPDDVVIAVLIHEVHHALSYQYDINGTSGIPFIVKRMLVDTQFINLFYSYILILDSS